MTPLDQSRELLAAELEREDFHEEAARVRRENDGLDDLDIDWECALRALTKALTPPAKVNHGVYGHSYEELHEAYASAPNTSSQGSGNAEVEAFRTAPGRITSAQLVELFGETMPVEVARIIADASDIATARAQIAALAASPPADDELRSLAEPFARAVGVATTPDGKHWALLFDKSEDQPTLKQVFALRSALHAQGERG